MRYRECVGVGWVGGDPTVGHADEAKFKLLGKTGAAGEMLF